MGFVERSFNLRFGLRFCIFVIIGVGAATLLLYYFTSKELGKVYGEAFFTIYNIKARLFPLVFASFQSLLIMVVVTAAIAVITLFFSHKIAGPIYRIESSLRAIGAGDLTTNTTVRTRDQIKDLADDVNGLSRSLNHRIRGLKDGLSGLTVLEDRLTSLMEKEPSQEELKEIAGLLNQNMNGLKRAIRIVKSDE